MGRRSRGEGSIYFETNERHPERLVTVDGRRVRRRGRWVARLVTDDGRRHRVTATTKSEASRKLGELKVKVASGEPVGDATLTVAGLLDMWMTKALPTRGLTASTIEVHEWSAGHWRRAIGGRRVRDLTVSDVERVLQRQADRGFSKSSLGKLRSTLSMALGFAERRHLVGRNVAKVAEMPHGVRPVETGSTFTPAQARAFAAAAVDSSLGGMFLLSLHHGLRAGEAAGAAWHNLDVDAGTLRIDQAIKRGPHGRLVVGPPKNARSVRTIAISPVVLDLLRDRRRVQDAERAAAGPAWIEEGLIFTNETGGPVGKERRRNEFRRVATAAGLDPDAWHAADLRHCFASLASAAGTPLEVICDQLGHSDLSMLGRHYRHATTDVVGAGAGVIGDVLADEA